MARTEQQDEIQDTPRERTRHALPRWYETTAAYAWRFLVVVAALWILVFVVVRLRLVFLPIFVALLLATLLAPPVGWLRARGWHPLLATWTVLLSSILVFAGIFALLVPQFMSQLPDLGETVRNGADEVVEWLGQGPLGLSEQQINSYVDRASQQIQSNSSAITGGVVSTAIKTGEFIAGTILALVVLFFFLKDGDVITSWARGLVAEPRRDHAAEMASRAWRTLSGYVRGTAVIATVDAVLIGAALLIVGNPLALPLAVITFFGAFFPIVGAVVAGAIAALVTLVTNGLTQALIITAVIVVIQQVEGDVLQPMVMGRTLRLHPLVILLALTAGGILAGIAGAFIAVPVAAVASSVGGYLRSLRPA